MKDYKRSNGLIQKRGYGGKFRKTTPEDLGIYNANKDCITYICNECGNEFTPIVHSGVCQGCGVDDKRVKPVIISDEDKEVLDKIKAIKNKPFINRKDLEEITNLSRQLKK